MASMAQAISTVPPSIRFCPYFYGIRLSDTGVRNVSWEYGN